MAYDEDLADRIRTSIGAKRGVAEIKMFGGLCFTVNGNMAVGALNDDMIVKIAKEDHDKLLKEPGARPFDFMKGRPAPKGIMFVDNSAVKTKAKLDAWISRGVRYAESLPAKAAKTKKKAVSR
ncbi:MAG: TfoX/Sxy family protein [Actinomycetota bacterium]